MAITMVHKLKITSMTVSSSQKLSEMSTLEFLRYGIEIKTGVILRCKLLTHNKQNVKIAMCQFVFKFFQLCFC